MACRWYFFHFWCRPNFAAICCLRHSFQRPKQIKKNSGANAPLFTIVEIEVANPNGDLWGYARQIRTRALQLTWSLLAVNFEPRDSFQRPSWCLYEAFCFLCFTCYLPPQMHAPTAFKTTPRAYRKLPCRTLSWNLKPWVRIFSLRQTKPSRANPRLSMALKTNISWMTQWASGGGWALPALFFAE